MEMIDSYASMTPVLYRAMSEHFLIYPTIGKNHSNENFTSRSPFSGGTGPLTEGSAVRLFVLTLWNIHVYINVSTAIEN